MAKRKIHGPFTYELYDRVGYYIIGPDGKPTGDEDLCYDEAEARKQAEECIKDLERGE